MLCGFGADFTPPVWDVRFSAPAASYVPATPEEAQAIAAAGARSSRWSSLSTWGPVQFGIAGALVLGLIVVLGRRAS